MSAFWQGRRVFVTGQTGFKGAWLCLWLERLGAQVTALALPPHTNPSLHGLAAPWSGQVHWEGDIRDLSVVEQAMHEADPEVVLHLAALALVRPSYREPVETFDTNVVGTGNILQAARSCPNLKAVVVVTSDKVYANDGAGRPFNEDDRLGGKDPYSASKAACELLVDSFRASFFAKGAAVGSVRAGNVIGGGDWSEDRLIPDLIRALDTGDELVLRYPDAVRPWQHVLEPLAGYLTFAERLATSPAGLPQALNFGPDPASFLTVAQVIDRIRGHFGGQPQWHRDTGEHPPEAAALTLTSTRAEAALNWKPRLDIDATLDWTASWYKAHRDGANMRAFSLAQIDRYQDLLT